MTLPEIDFNQIGWPGAIIIVVLILAFSFREVAIGRTLREVKRQVKNSHQTNLRDDVTDVQNAILGPIDPFDEDHRRRITGQGLHGMVGTLTGMVVVIQGDMDIAKERLDKIEAARRKDEAPPHS